MKVNLHVFVRFDLMNERDRLTRWVWPFPGGGILLIRPKDGGVEEKKLQKVVLNVSECTGVDIYKHVC